SGSLPFLTEEYEQLPQPLVGSELAAEDRRYYEAIREVMNRLAERGNVVIVGRGSSHILRGNRHVLRVGVVAHLEDRIERVMNRNRITREEAQKLIDARDKARAYYFKRLFDAPRSMAPELFHIMINSSEMSFDYATELVVAASQAIEARQFIR
ncbi:MAG: AAA family ATPase, partial [Ardenticatenaceae bacterium]